jgi:hypothetical protein
MEEDGIVGPAKGAGPRDVIPTVSGGSQAATPNYDQLFNEALNAGPTWTPEKADPILKALGNNFELKGSVAEGRETSNDLDIWQKKGQLSDAAAALKAQGFRFSHKTPHGEVWTRGDQAVDLWDSKHEPKRGLGKIEH